MTPPDRQLEVVARRAHGGGDGRPVDTDLQRLLDQESLVRPPLVDGLATPRSSPAIAKRLDEPASVRDRATGVSLRGQDPSTAEPYGRGDILPIVCDTRLAWAHLARPSAPTSRRWDPAQLSGSSEEPLPGFPHSSWITPTPWATTTSGPRTWSSSNTSTRPARGSPGPCPGRAQMTKPSISTSSSNWRHGGYLERTG